MGTVGLALAFFLAAPPAAAEAGAKDGAVAAKTTARPRRRFLLGLEAVAIQVPALRPTVVTLDPRRVGSTVALGGVGLFGRFRANRWVGVDLNVRSGSVRYRLDDDDVVSQDLILSEAGVLLYLASGEVGQFALDTGVGGVYNRVRYELENTGTQHYGSALFRLGASAEFLTKRVAFLLTLRAYGVLTTTAGARNVGDLGNAPGLPVARFQTYVSASAGVAYRF